MRVNDGAGRGADDSGINHWWVGLLGVLTISSYGAWYYAFGVFIDPILADTGWRESQVAFSFSLGLILLGLGSPLGGHLLDRLGHRWVFTLGGSIGGAGLLLASMATSVGWFIGLAAVGMGTFGALGFYHTTMSTVVRLHPTNAGHAIAVLTLWGAASSAIFLPLASWLTSHYGWRTASQILTLIAVASFAASAVLIPRPVPTTNPAQRDSPRTNGRPTLGASPRADDRPGAEGLRRAEGRPETDDGAGTNGGPGTEDYEGSHPPFTVVVRAMFGSAPARLFTVTVAAIGIAISTMLAYQVPVMVAGGLSGGLAASLAGARGMMQLSGRIPMRRMVARFGTDTALLAACASITASAVALRFSGAVPIAIAFVVLAGFGIGAFAPLQGIKATELFAASTLGTTLGLYSAVAQVVGAGGPAVAGLIAGNFGGRLLVPFIVLAAGLVALASVVGSMRVAHRQKPHTGNE